MLNFHRDKKIVLIGENRGEMGRVHSDHRQDDNVAVGGIGNLAR